MTASRRVAICGDGQLARGVADQLRRRSVEVLGPGSRVAATALLTSGADVVIVATTTRLSDVADDVRTAVDAGSNVIVSAEESAFPWSVDAAIANDIDALARARHVTVLGGGVNPGFVFDALTLTLLGPIAEQATLSVSRTVNIGRFGLTVLGRLGVGYRPEEFRAGVAEGRILGHAGFPQSMAVVADALGLSISRIDRHIAPIVTDIELRLPQLHILSGSTAGVRQTYVARVGDARWYEATFVGHVDPGGIGLTPIDEITVRSRDAETTCRLTPGIDAQRGSVAMIVNSLDRVIAAPAGWLTVADLPPAHPGGTGLRSVRTNVAS